MPIPAPPVHPPRPLPAVQRLFPRVYYGWVVAVAASFISFIVVGVGFYGMGVFLDALCVDRGWSRPAVSLATTVHFVVSGIVGSLIGRSVDRLGSRYWMAGGSVLMALALVALGRVETLTELVGAYFVLATGFAMAGPVPASALIARWFEGQRARAMSISQTGVSVGGIVLVPLMTRSIEAQGLAITTNALALVLLAIVLPISVLVLRSDPRRHGLMPDGVARVIDDQGHETPIPVDRPWTVPDALRTRTFWQLMVGFGGIFFCQVGAGMHQVSRIRADLGPELAAFAVSVTAAGSLVARLAVGSFADRVDQRKLGVVLMGLQSLALIGLSIANSPLGLFAASLCFGFTIGNLFMLQALLVGRLFGIASFATVLGLLQLMTQMASGLGPFALGLLYAFFDGYPEGYAVLSVLALVSGVVLFSVGPPHRTEGR